MGDSEKRTAKRIPFPCEVESTGVGQNPLNPKISDLSITGAFLDSMVELPPGTLMTLKFRLPAGSVVVVNAEVVHSMPHFGMGVRFLDLPDESRQAIEYVVTQAGRRA
jgi:PilZ domain